MRKLGRTFSVVTVLTAAIATGPTREKSEANASTANLPARWETATLAGGCFWSMQENLRQMPGVIKTTVGYTGGAVANPTYEMVCTGTTGHAEAVEVVFDPTRLSYEELLNHFFRIHDPTTLHRQINAAAAQYRSAVFYHSEEQRRTAGRVKDQISQSGKWNRPVVTEITMATTFYPAEKYHQDHFHKTSGTHNCRLTRD